VPPNLLEFFFVIESVSFGGDDSDFLHIFLLSGPTKVGNLREDKEAMSTDSWVGEEIVGTVSHYAVDGAGMVPCCPIGRREDWELLLPKVADRVCSHFPRDRFPMYEATFKEVGFRLPFSSFQISVLGWLEVCPSQLKPDCFAYMTALN
jgi:hypothetical protein